MKKNTVKLFILALTLGSSLLVSAQSKREEKKFPIHTERLKALSAQLHERYVADYDKAVALATINNWPLEIRKGSNYMQLLRVDEQGQPVYMSTHNEESAITSRVDKIHPGGSAGLNLTGMFPNEERIFIGVWDGEFPETAHPEFVGRFQTYGGISANIEEHPTHVLGTVMASGEGDAAARGMAYEAWGVVANFANDTAEMAQAASDGLLIISNHSYGIPSSAKGVYYENYARVVDELTYDNPYYQPMFSAGNQNGAPGSYGLIGDYAISKNAITVGACHKLDWVNQNTPVIASFSSWGPAADNRIKPDITTDGVDVYSTMPENTYDTMSGTSMSCPGVTGSLALIQQYYAEKHTDPEDIGFEPYTYMLSSTLRALTAHCATEAGNAPGPDPIFGWGILNAEKMADVITKEDTETLLLQETLAQSQTYEIEVEALGDEPLVATLAWTDPAPEMNSNTTKNSGIVNNLDLKIIKADNSEFFPWKLAATPSSPAVKGVNSVDTTEKIEVANASGTYKIRVTHQGTLKNPADPTQPQQVFSLVVSGINVTLDNKDFTRDSFTVWPNPAKGQLNISMGVAPDGAAKATVHDMQGRVVLQHEITAADTQLNIDNLTSGVYFVNIANGNKNEVKKFIVK